MSQIEDQRIVVWCKHDTMLQAALLDAVHLSIQLEKELCLFGNYQNRKQKNRLQQRISSYARVIKKDLPQLEISSLLLKGQLANLVKELGENYNTILFCSGTLFDRELLKAFYRSGFPFFFSKQHHTAGQRFKKVVIPIDFRNSTKDATLWGSYMGRFNQSDISLYVANDTKAPEQQQRVDRIVAFVQRFYRQFNFGFCFETGNKNSWGIHREAMEKTKPDELLIFTGSRNVSLPDRLIGPFEKRIVKKATSAVLLINPQQELFVLCN
ncbi:hypothetical protein [Roseimarinus sediminis]|uniref:hypothetical protein n=1 Tax=Roseimarinus sediminis TaxID=1610899 RepID=UPI003D258188